MKSIILVHFCTSFFLFNEFLTLCYTSILDTWESSKFNLQLEDFFILQYIKETIVYLREKKDKMFV